jgi:uncharacterized membrane protein YgdD (TMEM256/DUF423 family)
MQRTWIFIGALFGLGAVALAAIAAHAIPDANNARIVRSGIDMEAWHALALIGIGLWSPKGGRLVNIAGAAMALGTLLFCGAVYSHGLAGISLGPVAPIGGTLTMLGWLLLAISALRAR